MMNHISAKIERFPTAAKSAIVSNELAGLLEILRTQFPNLANVRFEFDGKLIVHIDVQKVEDVAMIEAQLPSIRGGIFSRVRRGKTPGRSFLHRVSAEVEV